MVRQWSSYVVGLALAVGMPVLGAVPAEAHAKPAAATYVYLDSQPGDWVGDGMTYVVPKSPRKLYVQGYRSAATMWITLEQGDTDVLMFLQNQSGGPITTGVHRFSGSSQSPYNVSFQGWGRGCASAEGTVNIRQLVFGRDGQVARLDLSFTQTCQFETGASARGRVAYRSTRAVAAPKTESVLRTGRTLRPGHSLTNISGTTGGTEYGDLVNRLTVRHGQAVLTHRVWPVSAGDHRYRDVVTWSTPTKGSGADRLVMRSNGTLALRTPAGKTVWSLKPVAGGRGDFLTVNNDGSLLLTNARFAKLWSVG